MILKRLVLRKMILSCMSLRLAVRKSLRKMIQKRLVLRELILHCKSLKLKRKMIQS